jgi:hypothetical protein
MKFLSVIGHPVILMSLYLLLVIESEHFGGFFILYLLMALPTGAAFSIVGAIGLVLVFLGYKLYRKHANILKPLLLLGGFIFLIISLFLFFSEKDRLETFHLTIPIIFFICFSLCSVAFVLNSFILIGQAVLLQKRKISV